MKIAFHASLTLHIWHGHCFPRGNSSSPARKCFSLMHQSLQVEFTIQNLRIDGNAVGCVAYYATFNTCLFLSSRCYACDLSCHMWSLVAPFLWSICQVHILYFSFSTLKHLLILGVQIIKGCREPIRMISLKQGDSQKISVKRMKPYINY